MSSISYRDHYTKYLPVYEVLATANGGKTVWIPTDAHDGWYVQEPVEDESSEAWKKGYPNKSRPSILPDDLSADVERTAYTTISYAKDESYKSAYFRETGDGFEWLDENMSRLPGYGGMTAWALFVDIDIDKKFKKRPLNKDHKKIVEQRLSLWVKAFSTMAGSIEHVTCLDSGGGMYVFVPPTALSPVADRYDNDELQLVFNEIGKRMRSVTGKLDELICDEDEAPRELFSADKVQNKNRQFKTIGSIHKDLNSVVYSVDPENIQIQYKPISDVTESDIEVATRWAENFTSDKHRDATNSIVEYLFQGQFTEREDMDIDSVDGDGWREILDSWTEDKKESIESWQKAREERAEISEEKLKTELTQDSEVAREAVRRVNNRKLKDYIVNYLGSDLTYEKSGEEMDFFPFWRGDSTESGRSAFYDYYEGKARFTDKADGTSRNIVYWVALEMTYNNEDYPDADVIRSPGDDLSGKEYAIALEELRSRGEDIPILVREVEDGEELSDWKIKQLGEKLGIVSENDIVIDDNGDGKLTPSAWNNTLERLSDEGITHNREKRKPLSVDDIRPPQTEDILQKYSKAERKDLMFNKKGYYEEEFGSREEYESFIEKLPEYVVAFKYSGDDEIAGGSSDGILAGVFGNQTDNTVSMSRFEPMITHTIDSIQTYEDLTIDTSESLKKKNLKIFVSAKD